MMKVTLAKAMSDCANEGARKLAMGESLSEWHHKAIELLHQGAEALNPTQEDTSSHSQFTIGKGKAGGHTVKK